MTKIVVMTLAELEAHDKKIISEAINQLIPTIREQLREPMKTVGGYITREELMDVLEITTLKSLRRKHEAGLKHRRIGNAYFYHVDDVAAFISQHSVE